jgi:hypothetical protein
MNHSDRRGLPYATAGIPLLAGVTGTRASSLPAALSFLSA